MDPSQIETALRRKFEQHRIVFWNDPQREFMDLLTGQMFFLDGTANVIRLDQTGMLEAKVRIEREDPEGRYLLYSPAEEPEYEHDWLLDMRLYSGSFRADRASILLSDLGLTNQSVRSHIHARRKFFDSKDRQGRLQALVASDDTEADLDRKMLAVVTRAEQPELFIILRTIFDEFLEPEDAVDLSRPPAVWEHVEKFDLDVPFWEMIKERFGYEEENPTLRNLLIRLLVTDLAHALKDEAPPGLGNLVLPKSKRNNVVVCLAQWRDSASKSGSYDALAEEVERIAKIDEAVAGFEIEKLLDVMTFPCIERVIMSGLRDRVLTTAETINVADIRRIANRRQSGHWASDAISNGSAVPRQAMRAVYDALVAAAEFFDLKNRHPEGFDFETPKAMYTAYEADLYRFDQLYRLFCENADHAEAEGWHVLKAFRAQLENVYVHWYLTQLSLAWGRFVSPESGNGLLAKWRAEGVPNQQQFFQTFVRSQLKGDYKRVFVIISDAFRYEAAQELLRELNGKYRFAAELRSQLGVLPSYTALGMASLLPHKSLAYKDDGTPLVDGKPAQSHAQRQEQLASSNGTAIKLDDLMAMRREQGREFVGDKEVIYVYHDAVDAVGDKQSSEKDTFLAVRRAIDEIGACVRHIINNLNGYLIQITADHGFLFTETPPDEADKSALGSKPPGTVIAKKRYLLGKNLPDDPAVWHGSTAVTAGAEGDMEFWVPKGVNLFHFTGGARFIHGGAMLQEIVVPVITVKHVRGKGMERTQTKQVTVHVLGAKHKITTSQHRFQLIQMEAVSERVRPVTLRVALYEGDEPITNVENVTFDSDSGNIDERKKWVRLVLKDRQYDKNKPYRLVLRDAETGVEHQSVEVTVDRAFGDDF